MTPPGQPATPAPRIRKATLKAFDSATWTATVQITGSLSTYLEGVPVAEDLDETLLTAGAKVGVVFLDDSNPTDAAVAFVYGGVPPAASRARAYQGNTSANWPDAAWQIVALDNEFFDGLAEFDTTAYRFTAGAAGYYAVAAQVYFTNVNNGDKIIACIRKNGGNANYGILQATADYDYTINLGDILYLAAGDYLELWSYWDYAAETDHYLYDTNTGSYTFMAIHRLS